MIIELTAVNTISSNLKYRTRAICNYAHAFVHQIQTTHRAYSKYLMSLNWFEIDKFEVTWWVTLKFAWLGLKNCEMTPSDSSQISQWLKIHRCDCCLIGRCGWIGDFRKKLLSASNITYRVCTSVLESTITCCLICRLCWETIGSNPPYSEAWCLVCLWWVGLFWDSAAPMYEQ